MKKYLFFILSFIFFSSGFAQKSRSEFIDEAQSYISKKDIIKAIDCYSQLINLFPKDSTAYLDLALLKQQVHDYKGAIQDFTIGGKINTKEPDYFFLRGMLYQKLGKYKKAIADFNITMKKEVNADAYRFRGQIKELKKDFKGAMNDYNKAEKINKYSEIYRDRGALKLKLNQSNAALIDLNIAIQIDSLDEHSYFVRSKVYKKLQNKINSIKDIDKAIELNKEQANYYLFRAKLEFEDGLNSKACSDYLLYKKYGGKQKFNFICK